MHRINRTRRNPAGARNAAAVLAVLLLIGLGLAACGSSGSSTTTATGAGANTPATKGSNTGTGTVPNTGTGTVPNGATGPTRARSPRLAALRECLQKNGVALPKRTLGGVSRAQLEAALKKCGAGGFGGLGGFGKPAYAQGQALTKFAACMRSHGVNLPEPNTSGNGPIFNTKGLNTSTSQFRTAEAACRSVLRSAAPSAGPTG